MQKEENYSNDLLNLLFDQFNERSGSVENIEVYKASELDYVENSEKVAEVLFNSADFEPGQELQDLYENEWGSVSDVFDYLTGKLPKGRGVKHETFFSYVTTGAPGTGTSFNMFAWDKKAIFYETADGFTPGMHKIEPVDSQTDLTKLTTTYFLKDGFPSVDLFSLVLNPKWIDEPKFRKMLMEKLKEEMASGNRRAFTENLREMINAYSKDGLKSKVKEKDLKVIVPIREGRLEEIPQNIIESLLPYLFEDSNVSEST